MNKVILVGRLTSDPDIKTTNDDLKIARYRLAVDRRIKRDGQPTADFISCVAFGHQADFAEKYMRKGRLFGAVGRIQTGSYTKQDGTKVYTTDVIVEDNYFMEPKSSEDSKTEEPKSIGDGFLDLPEEDLSDLPFS